SHTPAAEQTMAAAVRTVLGLTPAALSDDDAIAQVLDGSKNPYLGHALFLGMHSKLMQTMNHVPFTFQKRISGAEEAQNQRHRGTLSSGPILSAHLRRDPDVILPWAIARNPAARAEYDATVRALWDAKNALLDQGASSEVALYLLPNAHRVRFYESGTLLTYFWKWIKRLCYDAQREIFATARQEVAQLRQVHPTIGRYVDGPPCVMRSRSGAKPICPEGERYCGIPVWRGYEFAELEERRVM
ncbi:MAG: FAD-dependent thymidylate synthase, partial [Thermomicrobiales bacterium]